MMRYYSQLGDRNAVIRQYQQLVEVRAAELQIEPMSETQALYQTLRRGDVL
jgi:DNA-binding SARP family transcriptional activator